MRKFLGSKVFVSISTFFTLVIGGIAGWLLGYQPNVTGSVSGGMYVTNGTTTTKYIFQIKYACGYWLLAILITFVVFLLCMTIRKLYIQRKTETEIEK